MAGLLRGDVGQQILAHRNVVAERLREKRMAAASLLQHKAGERGIGPGNPHGALQLLVVHEHCAGKSIARSYALDIPTTSWPGLSRPPTPISASLFAYRATACAVCVDGRDKPVRDGIRMRVLLCEKSAA
jgi:hypothetical protein